MFRRVEDMEGGADDPRDVSEWWKASGKNTLIPLLIFVGFIVLIAAIFS